jgi:adenylate kinase
MKLIVIGPPGSGKGTQAQMICDKFGIPHIEAGKLLREAVSDKSRLSEEEKKIMERGELLPDTFVADILTIRLMEPDARDNFVLDGYPRTLRQAELLEKITRVDLVINIILSPSEIVKRLSGRRSCKNCGQVYNIFINPPKREGICDKCNSPLFIREDDKPGVIEHRIDVYNERTKPLLEYYGHRHMMNSVDGSRSIMEIFDDIVKVLENKV